jgi:uncharacterized protein (DUF305 family)
MKLLIVLAAVALTADVSPNSRAFAKAMRAADAKMRRAMTDAKRNGDPDHDFASAMIGHHQGAIDMAKVELQYGSDPSLRRMAQDIISSQQQEMEVIQHAMYRLPEPPPPPAPNPPR